MSLIIKPGQDSVRAIIAARIDPLAIELRNAGLPVIIIATAPTPAVSHCAFSTHPQALADDLKKICAFYFGNADKLQSDAIKARRRRMT